MTEGKPIREAFYPLSENPDIQAEFILKMKEQKPGAKAIKTAGESLGITEESKEILPHEDFVKF